MSLIDTTAPTPRDPAALAHAFVGTTYRVLPPVDIAVAVGQPCPVLEDTLPAHHYGYITAHDPDAIAHPPARNAAADRALRDELVARGLMHHRMESQAADGSAHELGWLVLDAGDAGIDALGRAYGQAAVLGWSAGTPVVLRMLMTAPVEVRPSPWVRWIE